MESEFDILSEYEYKKADFDSIKDMLWLIYEDYFVPQSNDIYLKANNYDRLEIYLMNIHSLLNNTTKEMKEFIDNVYKTKKVSE